MLNTLSPDAPYLPTIDPRLSPYVEHALARLETCKPDIYQTVRAYVSRFEVTEYDVNLDDNTGGVLFSQHTLEIGPITDGIEVQLMAIIAHEARHVWQSNNGLDGKWSIDQLELDAYSFELPVLSCPTTEPDVTAWYRGLVEQKIAEYKSAE
ncbi:MAG: hypothetical protein M1482_12705 [Chloroflexi bacterium]|nr:hypothetical protein [Chloroflexota bacterium]